MNLITFTFEVAEEDQLDFVKTLDELRDFWEEKDFTVSLFRDRSRQTRFLQLFLTDKSVDELTDLIQNQPRAKAVFEKIKDAGSGVVVSVMEQIV